jgi:hypothetical protein
MKPGEGNHWGVRFRSSPVSQLIGCGRVGRRPAPGDGGPVAAVEVPPHQQGSMPIQKAAGSLGLDPHQPGQKVRIASPEPPESRLHRPKPPGAVPGMFHTKLGDHALTSAAWIPRRCSGRATVEALSGLPLPAVQPAPARAWDISRKLAPWAYGAVSRGRSCSAAARPVFVRAEINCLCSSTCAA